MNRHPGSEDDKQRRARQRRIDRQLRVWTPARITGWAMVGLAVAVGIVHWLAHLDWWRPIPIPMGWQDILLGYPAAGLLGVVGAIIIGTSPAPPR